ncbi:MAG: alanine racemase [Bradymonadaceae bacterium]|nr:alanine racemase [Lujinxingiaceae bacterium]
MKLTLGLVEELTGGRILRGAPDLELFDVVVDSRTTLPGQCLFVAIEGARFDGHGFVSQAIARGAAAVLVHRGAADDYPEGAVVIVDNTLRALQQLAAGWRARFEGPVIGITGSNGKTIVKDMLAAIVGQRRTVYRSPGSYNSQVGVPLAVLGIRAQHEIALIEAGISQPGEMELLEAIVGPTAGIVTNIGLAHAAGLKDLETTAREKLRLFAHLDEGALIYPAGDPTLARCVLAGRPVPVDVRLEGQRPPADVPGYVVFDVHANSAGFGFRARLPDASEHDFALHVPGEHNIYNAAAAIAMASELGCSPEEIRQGLAGFELSEMRLEMHTTQGGVTLINDAYNSDPISARAALGVLKRYSGGQRTVAIVGDMLDLGVRGPGAHRDLGEVVARVGVDLLVCMGELAGLVGEGARQNGMAAEQVHEVADFDALHEFLEAELVPGDVVLFKASRNIGLERAAQRLLESVAPTRLIIDLDAIADNFHAIRRRIGPKTGLMAVVKSFGYGNDATRVAQTLIQQGVDALAVAYPDEAIALRKKGLTIPILVTNVLEPEADKIPKYDLTALVYSLPVARALQRHGERRNKIVPVHLEVDTGMNRVGLEPAASAAFATALGAMANLRIEGVMTHFAAADDAAEDDFTRAQIAAFEGVLVELRGLGLALPHVHAANTAAAWRFPEARYDLVRIGLGLYGLHPGRAVAEQATSTRPALRMTTRVIHLHDIEAGQSVGYGRTFRAAAPVRLATIAVGYNDGFPRFMSNGGEVLIGGERCAVAGNVCMDVAMVDVSAVAGVEIGDEVVLFGTQGAATISVDEWAARGRTINYEILCNLSPRVRRIFLKT